MAEVARRREGPSPKRLKILSTNMSYIYAILRFVAILKSFAFAFLGQKQCFLGTGDGTKKDEFLEKFQMAVDPPPLIFGNFYCIFFPRIPI